MFSSQNYYPVSSFDNFDRVYRPSFAPERYQAKASYLDDEELQLRLRLEEIQSQRDSSYFDSRDTFERTSHQRQYYGQEHHPRHSTDRLALLRRELAEEELRVERQNRLDLEREDLRKREIMEAGRLALLRKEEENRLELVRRRREQEEQRLLELRLAERQAEHRRLAARVQQPRPPVRFVVNPSANKSSYGNNKIKAPTVDFQTILKQLAEIQNVVKPHPQPKPSTSPQEAETNEATLQDVVQLLFSGGDPRTKQETVGQHRPTLRPEQRCCGPARSLQPSTSTSKDTSKATPSASQPQAKADERVRQQVAQQGPSLAEAVTPLDFLNLMFGAGQLANKSAETTQPSSSKAKPTSQSAVNVAPPKRAESPSASLKEQLEARLANDETTEIRDTIQAILASLADATTYQTPQGPSPSTSGSSKAQPESTSVSGKGKGKEQTPVVTEPSSNDVLKSMETIHNIDAAFSALKDDFVFPSQLDFTPTSSAAPSPASSDNESTTPTITKLAYTSKNHPVRYYEQNLSALLAQLDGVESFGNSDVRTVRKEVVARVESALDELEREVEGRWRIRAAKDVKEKAEESVKPVDVEVAVVHEDVTSVTEHADTTPAEETTTSPAATSADEQTTTSTQSEPEVLVTVNETVPTLSTVSQEENQSSSDSTTPESESESVNDAVSAQSHAEPEPTSMPVSAEIEDVKSEEVIPASEEQDFTVTDSEDPLSLSVSYHPSSYPPAATSNSSSAAASVATLHPYDVEAEAASTSSEEEEEVEDSESDLDEFLLSEASRDEEKVKRDTQEDVGSDWSEVEA